MTLILPLSSVPANLEGRTSLVWPTFCGMSNIYLTEPPTHGKVLLHTSFGDIDVELWSKECPMACRNFVQLAMEGVRTWPFCVQVSLVAFRLNSRYETRPVSAS